MATPETRDWTAWVDRMPGLDGPTLHVTATCAFPTAGWIAELVLVDQQDDPADVHLRLVVHAPDGVAAEAITDVPIDYAGPVAGDPASVSIEMVVETIPVDDVE